MSVVQEAVRPLPRFPNESAFVYLFVDSDVDAFY